MKISEYELDLEHQVEETWRKVKKGKSKPKKPKTLKHSAIRSVLQTEYDVPTNPMRVEGVEEPIADPLRFVAEYLKNSIGVVSQKQITRMYPSEIEVPVPNSNGQTYAYFYRRQK